jgi:transporter family-2 protein
MSRHLILILVVLAGAGIPIQMAANHQLGKSAQSPLLSIILAFCVGLSSLLFLYATGIMDRGHLTAATHAPWWAWCGGLLSAFVIIISIIALPLSNAATVTAVTICGQLVAAAAIDHFGWLGVPQLKIHFCRVIGLLLVCGGVFLIHKN